ncbi:MAG TPA: hypothetical protein O0X27_01750 [Methanocorpusculum sp.]|nr:hypothetical protein [Methanocorpusculum sp.]
MCGAIVVMPEYWGFSSTGAIGRYLSIFGEKLHCLYGMVGFNGVFGCILLWIHVVLAYVWNQWIRGLIAGIAEMYGR